MAKLVKFKYIIIALVIAVAVLSASLISISYSKWTGGAQAEIVCGAKTGVWINYFNEIFNESNQGKRDEKIDEFLKAGGIESGNGVITSDGKVLALDSEFSLKENDQFVAAGSNKQAIGGVQIGRYGIINGTAFERLATNPSKNIRVDNGVVTVINLGKFKVVIQNIGGAKWMVIQDA